MERWRQIQEYSLYQVSDRGRIRRRRKVGYRVLKPLISRNGYCQVCLFANGKGRRVLIHALAAAFIGQRPSSESTPMASPPFVENCSRPSFSHTGVGRER